MFDYLIIFSIRSFKWNLGSNATISLCPHTWGFSCVYLSFFPESLDLDDDRTGSLWCHTGYSKEENQKKPSANYAIRSLTCDTKRHCLNNCQCGLSFLPEFAPHQDLKQKQKQQQKMYSINLLKPQDTTDW